MVDLAAWSRTLVGRVDDLEVIGSFLDARFPTQDRLSGSVDIVVEGADGQLRKVDTAGAGSFVGQDGLADPVGAGIWLGGEF